jgi:uncharacterized repeat protein (TIGR03803 family)
VVVGLAILATMALLLNAAWASTSVVFSFAGEEGGEYPSTELVMDSAGSLYGTSVLGGDFGGGTVFQLTKSGDTWTHTVLHSFRGGVNDGAQPYGGVTLDADGNLYGTTVEGGSGGACEGGCGIAYKLTAGTWNLSILHHFTGGADGSGPGAGLTFDANGRLYGMTPTGGQYGLGTIYQLTPNQDGALGFRVVHAFTGGADGSSASAGRLLFDGAHLFGVATTGGAFGQGVAFALVSRNGGQTWAYRTIYAFHGQPDAGFPYGGLTRDQAGNLYGTTYYDGQYDMGAVYQLAPRQGGWKERVLYSFRGGQDGAFSISNLVFGANGHLYGTTSEGGAPGCGCGTVFDLAPAGQGQWTESVAYAFTGTPDGAFPYNGLVTDGVGNFYGSTVHGGEDNEGSVYQFTP